MTRSIAFATAASWMSRAVSISSGLVLLPILFRKMSADDLGMWLLLGQSWSAMGVFDFGFTAVLARQIALARGRNSAAGDRVAEINEISDLLETGSRVSRVLALAAFTVSMLLGYSYLSGLNLSSDRLFTMIWVWAMICAGQAIGIWSASWSCLLIGLGHAGWEIALNSAVSLLGIVAQITSALLGGGVIALASIQVVSAVAARLLFRQVVRRQQAEVLSVKGHWRPSVVRQLTTPAIRSWLTALGGVLILQTDQFFVAKFQSTAALPSYRAAYVLCLNVQMLAVTVATATAPYLSQAWEAGRVDEVKAIVARTMRLGLCLTIAGLALIGVAGPDIFQLWLGPGHFAGYALLGIFLIMMFMEAHTFMLSTLSRATADEAFAGWSLGAGILKLVVCFVLAEKYGLIGIAASTLVAQATTMYWYSIVRSLGRLEIPWSRYVRAVIVPVVLVASSILFVGLVTKMGLEAAPYKLRLATVTTVVGLVGLTGLVLAGTDKVQRHRLWVGLRKSVAGG